MLEKQQKENIQTAYSAFLDKKKLKGRSGQKQMIAEIARALSSIEVDNEGYRVSDPSVTVIEAGTGTGKTVGYVLPAVVMSQAAEKCLIIATATVALQEQVINKDLPDIIKNTGLQFTYTLAKGRGRYACLSKLDRIFQEEDTTASLIDLLAYEDDTIKNEKSSLDLYQKMLDDFSTSRWGGDRDSWSGYLTDHQWKLITTDHAQCTGHRCLYFRQCPFYTARAKLESADVIVANHDLVLADLALGGGAILPAPKDSIYVFDEGHHLPDKAIDHFTCHARLKGTSIWLEKAAGHLKKILEEQAFYDDSIEIVKQIQSECQSLSIALGHTRELIQSLVQFEPKSQLTTHGEKRVAYHRFSKGIVPKPLSQQAELLKIGFSKCNAKLEKVTKSLSDAMKDHILDDESKEIERLYYVIGGMQSRMENHFQLWLTYTQKDPEGRPPLARWLKRTEDSFGKEIEVFSSPIMSSETLYDTLWNQAFACIVTSATLAISRSFDWYRMRSGLPEHAHCSVVPSPFLYKNAASLVIPAMASDPRDTQTHTAEVVKLLGDLFKENERPRGFLVLFASRRQMKDVYSSLTDYQNIILLQDDYSPKELLKLHRENVDKGCVSVLFGLASLAEGVDLPGYYCEHVVIAKIPFAVPDDPVAATLSEWLTSKGRNPFMEITVPDATTNLIQACGRLLRKEQDFGRITIFDRRLITARYGKVIRDALPPFNCIVES